MTQLSSTYRGNFPSRSFLILDKSILFHWNNFFRLRKLCSFFLRMFVSNVSLFFFTPPKSVTFTGALQNTVRYTTYTLFNEKFLGWEFYFNRKRKPRAIVLKSLLKIFCMQYNIIKIHLESSISQRASNTDINVVNTNYHKCTNRKQFANFWSRFHSHNSLRNTFTQPFQFPYKMTIFQRHEQK